MSRIIKKSHTLNMTEGKPLKLILTFAIPLFIGSIFQQIYNVVDTMVAGHVLGDQAIAAIGATSSIYGLIIQLSWGLASGFVIVLTRTFGAGDIARIRRTLASSFVLSAFLAIIMTAVAAFILRPVMHLMNAPESIFEQAYSYMIVILLGLSVTMTYNLFAGIMRAFGNSVTPLYVLIFSSLLNIGLDILFVAGLHMGVAGAALATILAQAVSAVICGVFVFRNYREYLPSREDFIPDWPLIKEMLSTGGAMSLMYSIVSIGSMFFQGATNALGDTVIAAHAASEKIIVLLMGPLSSVMDATATFVGQNWGAGRKDRVRMAFRQTMLLEAVMGAANCLLVYALGSLFIRWLTGTEDPEMISYGLINLRTVTPFYPILGVLFILRTSMQAIGQKLVPVVSSAIELCVRAFGAFVMVPALGYPGVALNTSLTWTSMTVFIFVCYVLKTRKMLHDQPASAVLCSDQC